MRLVGASMAMLLSRLAPSPPGASPALLPEAGWSALVDSPTLRLGCSLSHPSSVDASALHDEISLVLEGSLRLTPADTSLPPAEFGPGELLFVPRGWVGTVQVLSPTRRLCALLRDLPVNEGGSAVALTAMQPLSMLPAAEDQGAAAARLLRRNGLEVSTWTVDEEAAWEERGTSTGEVSLLLSGGIDMYHVDGELLEQRTNDIVYIPEGWQGSWEVCQGGVQGLSVRFGNSLSY